MNFGSKLICRAGSCLFLLTIVVSAQPLYTVTPVAAPEGTDAYSNAGVGINGLGQIAGQYSRYAADGGNQIRSFFHSDATGTLDLFPDPFTSSAEDINNGGQIALYGGDRSGPSQAYRYTPGIGFENLGTFGGTSAQGQAINNAGQVTGFARVGRWGQPSKYHLILYCEGGIGAESGTGPRPLGCSRAIHHGSSRMLGSWRPDRIGCSATSGIVSAFSSALARESRTSTFASTRSVSKATPLPSGYGEARRRSFPIHAEPLHRTAYIPHFDNRHRRHDHLLAWHLIVNSRANAPSIGATTECGQAICLVLSPGHGSS